MTKQLIRLGGLIALVSLLWWMPVVKAAYVFQSVAGEAFDPTTTNVVWNNNPAESGFPLDDDYQLVNIGFTFYLGETAYTQVRILGNGALHFGADQGFHKDYTNEALPITNDCNDTGSACPGFEEPADRTILGYWDDLEPTLGGTVRYNTFGTAPNRRFVASWENVPRYNGPTTSYSFQIVLFEDGSIRFRYGNDQATGASATIGIELSDTDFTEVSFNTNSVSDANDILWTREFPLLNSATAECTDKNKVTVTFDSPISPIRATNPANFSIDNSITVSAATLVNPTTVELTTSTLLSGITYTLTTSTPTQTASFQLGTLTTASFLDTFSAVSFSNDDGTDSWSGDWIETDDNGLAASGRVFVGGGTLNMNDRPNSGGRPRVEREVDLTGFTSASFTFTYSTSNNLEGSDRFDVAVSANGGASYTILQTYRNDVSGTDTFDITPFISANTRIRIRIERGYGGNSELLTIDDVTITGNQLSPCAISVDHYRIEHDGNGLTCDAETITIKACADATCTTLSSDSVSLNFQADGVTQSSPTFTGSTTVNLSQTTPDTLTLSIASPSIAATNPLVCDSGTGSSCDIIFADTGFQFLANGVASSIPVQLSGKPSNTGYNSQTLSLQAIQKSPVTGACEAALTSSTVIELAATCKNPATCAGQQVVINNTVTNTNIVTLDDAALLTYSNVSLDFGTATDNTAEFILTYPDAGIIQLHARYNIPESGLPSGDFMLGNSNNFLVRPFGYDIQIAGNTYVDDQNDTVLTSAGTNFQMTVRSVLWEAADDTDNNGIPDPFIDTDADATPDSGGDLSNNNITPNIALISENLTLTPTALVVTNSNGTLLTSSIPLSSFSLPASADEGTYKDFNQNWSEVGILQLDAASNNFMGETGENVTGQRINIGRFTPHHYKLVPTNIVPQCGTFSYAGFADGVNAGLDRNGQTFNADGTITAENLANNTTLNYAGVFAKLVANQIAIQPYDSTSSTNASGQINSSFAALNFVSGVSSFSSANTDYQYDALADAFDLRLDYSATDSDSITSGTVSSNDFEVRIGRLRLIDSYGPEVSPLEMRLESEYFDGSAWSVNISDSCTTYIDTNSSFDLTSYTENLVDGNTAPFFPNLAPEALNNGLSSLANGLWYSAPNNFGSVLVNFDLASQGWLRFDWDGDNTIENTTSGLLNFGYYRGSDRVIYWQELP